MRYKKGTKVEVLNKGELPSGSWRCAEIISGNGHTYNVKYDSYSSGMTGPVEKVPRKVIRPSPPVMRGFLSCVPGDIVELSDNGSWKLAKVMSVVDRSYFSVRLLGSSIAFNVQKSDVRLRQCWDQNRWIVIGKNAENSADRKLVKEGCLENMKHKNTNGFPRVQNSAGSVAFEDSKLMPSGGTKRGLQYYSSPLETCHSSIKKIKACDKEDIHQQLAAVSLDHLKEKVDAVVLMRKMLGEKCIRPSLINRTGLSDVHIERGKPNGDVISLCAGISESSDATICSSSGSNNLDMLYDYPFVGPCLDVDSLSDDADSSCLSKPEAKQPILMKKALAAKIHELELHAYRSVMKALYSSGAITWEQEDVISNLRCQFHISNHEHLLELRHLLSSKSEILKCPDSRPRLL